MEAACFYILYNDYIIRTVGGVVVLKRDVSAAGCRNHSGNRDEAVFVISQAPDSAYVRIE